MNLMNEKNNFLKNKHRLKLFSKGHIKEKKNLQKNIFYTFEKSSLCFIRLFKFVKIKANLIRLFIFILFIILYFCINKNVKQKFKDNTRENNQIKNHNKLSKFESEIEDKKFIVIKNAEGEPDTFAKIIIQNKIDYIPKISVIIPINNMGEYLSEFLETVINQTLKEIEIICVDDGSIDNSLDILKNLAIEDKRITIIRQENYNAGVARNTGLAVAKGKYLSFLDSEVFLDLNMLKELYENIYDEKSDIIICNCQYIESDIGKINRQKFNNSFLIDKKHTFSSPKILNRIFQFSNGLASEKLFRNDFILSNNIKFQNILSYNDYYFTYTAFFLSKSITTLENRFILKKYKTKKSLIKKEDKFFFLLSIDKIKSFLDKKDLNNITKESFWNWVNKLCISKLKKLNNDSKNYLYNILHEKLNSWKYNDYLPPILSQFTALNYIKLNKVFPTINIAYVINNKNINLFLISLISILKNSDYENINLILLYNNINQSSLKEINKLKDIHFFTLQTLYISDEQFKDFGSTNCIKKESDSIIFLFKIFFFKFSGIDKILYLSCNTIVRKSLLCLWEINLNNKLIAGFEDFLYNKDKEEKINLKDNLYINNDLFLLNIKEWRKIKLNNNSSNNFIYNNKICYTNREILNIFTDSKKIRLKNELIYIKILKNDTVKYNNIYFENLINKLYYKLIFD